MSNDLTTGEFATLTGLSHKALRLYAERGILAPAAVDAESGYRRYARSQLRHGLGVDLLRRAQVPLSGLLGAESFDFANWRQAVNLRRQFEDFYLAVAEHVADFDPADFTAHSEPADALDWVGVVVDLSIPEDAEGRIEMFSALAVDTPAVEKAFHDALAELGRAPAEVSWTAVPETATRSGAGPMVLARPGPPLDRAERALVEERVRARAGRTVGAVNGTLPQRVEITFTTTAAAEPTGVQEAADGYLQLLVFEDHIRRNGLDPVALLGRQVVRGPSVFDGMRPSEAEPGGRGAGGGEEVGSSTGPSGEEASGGPITVFDVRVAPPSNRH
ncbi:MerR family DNA-binding transcriptional regulator [Streptomyces sp. P38-E01]|uniref:MerR family DNA-binding transcriptional regulator n=1 Tax=Streptomyces tardus TaxID=2780544 RepID=A0A949JSH3_9ACTN|nr:MerR family DNA-binding transcriptional regulator [Streptomyces tardus]MBU7599335.1 MerR family DNA-binding transcriptional regulator [Streptomyces tardus]